MEDKVVINYCEEYEKIFKVYNEYSEYNEEMSIEKVREFIMKYRLVISMNEEICDIESLYWNLKNGNIHVMHSICNEVYYKCKKMLKKLSNIEELVDKRKLSTTVGHWDFWCTRTPPTHG